MNETLQDVCNNKLNFGGKKCILGVDYKQILPVLKQGIRSDIIQSTNKFSKLWPLFYKMELTKNVRSKDEKFSSFLLKIGKGLINPFIIPENWKTDDVCSTLYGGINTKYWINRVILCPHNEDTRIINNRV